MTDLQTRVGSSTAVLERQTAVLATHHEILHRQQAVLSELLDALDSDGAIGTDGVSRDGEAERDVDGQPDTSPATLESMAAELASLDGDLESAAADLDALAAALEGGAGEHEKR